MDRRNQLGLALGLVWLSLMACTPIITIGYGEILILILVLIVFVGPVFYRFIRTRSTKKHKNEDQGQD